MKKHVEHHGFLPKKNPNETNPSGTRPWPSMAPWPPSTVRTEMDSREVSQKALGVGRSAACQRDLGIFGNFWEWDEWDEYLHE